MINFVTHNATYYMGVLYSLINPIVEHLDNYTISKDSKDKCVNVHFFKEPQYLKAVGTKGISVFLSHGLADKSWAVYKGMDGFDYINVPGNFWYKKMINP